MKKLALLVLSLSLLGGCKPIQNFFANAPSLKGRQQSVENELYPKFSIEKGIGFKRLEDGIDLRVDLDGDGREDIAYKLVPVGYNEETGVYLMVPLEGYIDRNKNEQYTEDEHFNTALAGG